MIRKLLFISISLFVLFASNQHAALADVDLPDASAPGVYTAYLHDGGSILDIVGSCYPQSIELSSTPCAGVRWPTPLEDPLYGFIRLNREEFPLVIDRVADPAALFIDLDRSGRFQEIEWMRRLADGRFLAAASFRLYYEAEAKPLCYPIFLIWNPFSPYRIVFCRASYRRGELELGGIVYQIVLVDENTDGRYDDLEQTRLYIDLDRDGVFLATDYSHERYWLSEPFNIAGTVYRVASVSPGGTRMVVEDTDEWVAEKPSLAVGAPAPLFTAIDRAGAEIALTALRGEIVLLVFWASWCPACREELLQLAAIVADYTADRVVMIGINLDQNEECFLQAAAEYDFFSFQIHDDLGGPISRLYRITVIPFLYLIDREGMIRGRGLRGEQVRQAIATLLDEQQ